MPNFTNDFFAQEAKYMSPSSLGIGRFEIVIAHYLFCLHYHSGQNSDLYKRLCRITGYFSPGPIMSDDIEDHDFQIQYVYDNLVQKHGFNI